MRFSRYIFFLCFVCSAACCYAQPNTLTPLNSQQLKQLAFEQPVSPQWQFSYFDEPVFNSKMLVLEAGETHLPKLLLVHGLGALAMQDWFGIIDQLTPNYHVIAVDLPGFGRSESPAGRYSPKNYAAVLAELIAQLNTPAVTVVGHSMGGAVSLYLAGQYPQKVKKLVLVDAAGILQKTAFIKPITALPKPSTLLPWFLQNSFINNKLAQLNDLTASIVEDTSIDSFFAQLLQSNDGAWQMIMGDKPNINAAMSLVEQDFSEIVTKVTAPTAIIWGENDPIAPLRTGLVLHHKIENSTLMVQKGSAHVPMKDNTAEFMHNLMAALAQTRFAKPKAAAFPALADTTLTCQDRQGGYFSGAYQNVVINNCSNVVIEQLYAQSISINNSLVSISDSELKNSQLALQLTNSVVQLTNTKISAEQGINIIKSRLDAAGVSIDSKAYAVNVNGESHVIFSLSDVTSRHYKGVAHGAYELGSGLLDTVLNSK